MTVENTIINMLSNVTTGAKTQPKQRDASGFEDYMGLGKPCGTAPRKFRPVKTAAAEDNTANEPDIPADVMSQLIAALITPELPEISLADAPVLPVAEASPPDLAQTESSAPILAEVTQAETPEIEPAEPIEIRVVKEAAEPKPDMARTVIPAAVLYKLVRPPIVIKPVTFVDSAETPEAELSGEGVAETAVTEELPKPAEKNAGIPERNLPKPETKQPEEQEINPQAVTPRRDERIEPETVRQPEAARRVTAPAEVVSQIVSRIKADVSPGVSEIRIQLKPESLGEVSMKITVQNGIVTAQFFAESQRVKEAIEAGFTNLKDNLAQRGLNVAQLSVAVGDGNSGGAARDRMAEEARRAFTRIRYTDPFSLEPAETIMPDYVDERVLQGATVDYRT